MDLRCQNRALFGEALIVGRRTILVSSDGQVVGLELDEAMRLLQDPVTWIVERKEVEVVAAKVPAILASSPVNPPPVSVIKSGKMKPLILKEK